MIAAHLPQKKWALVKSNDLFKQMFSQADNTTMPHHSQSHFYSRLYNFHPSKHAVFFLVLLAILAFTALPVYKSLRQPRIGDADNLRLGLLTLNRYAIQSFPRDTAMQAGTWWPGYTPWYLFMLGSGYQLIADLGIVFAIITAIDYISLLVGFYWVGRQLGFPISVSLTLAYMSGLYQVTGHGLAWAGVGNEMAAPRNIYLALFPWILLAGLCLYRRIPYRLLHWFLFGVVLGLSTILHSITGGFVVSVFVLMMLVGVMFGHFDWQRMLAFLVGAIPGSLIGYGSISSTFEISTSLTNNIVSSPFVYFSIARANVFFYRIPSWSIPIAAFTLLTLFTGVLLWRHYRLKHILNEPLWLAFGLLQFGALLLTLLIDWWTLFVAIEWVRQVRAGKSSPYERLTLTLLTAINFSTLSISSSASILGHILGSNILIGMARLFQRGQALGYAGLIILSCFILWDRLQRYPARALYFGAIVTTAIIGLHQAEFENIPGQWLPFDYWIYLGVLLLVLWPWFNQPVVRNVRIAAVCMLIVQATTRILGLPAPAFLTLLIGLIILTASLLYNKLSELSRARRSVAGGASLAIMLLIVLPIGGTSFLSDSFVQTRKVILRDWSRRDTQSFFSIFYPIGTWLRENTPADSLILTDMTELRYWSFRSQTVGRSDAQFLRNYPTVYDTIQQEALRVKQAFNSADALLAYARKAKADYIVINKNSPALTPNTSKISPIFKDGDYIILQLNSG